MSDIKIHRQLRRRVRWGDCAPLADVRKGAFTRNEFKMVSSPSGHPRLCSSRTIPRFGRMGRLLYRGLGSCIEALAPAKHFRGTILVERNGQPLIQKNYGIAVEEWQIPISSDTRFEIASLSKQFTAAAILLLADSGKLNVEHMVSKYYPDSPPAWKGMTIHHLLTHTSGLPENEWGNFYKGKAVCYDDG